MVWWVMVFICFTMAVAMLGAGPVGPLSGDFPATRGLLPIQACSGAMVDPARRRLVRVVVFFGLQEDLFVISSFFRCLSVIWKQ
jgi:hypothetical protein